MCRVFMFVVLAIVMGPTKIDLLLATVMEVLKGVLTGLVLTWKMVRQCGREPSVVHNFTPSGQQ